MKYTTLALGLLLAGPAVAETPVLTVYTYDSFVSDWGPGPQVEEAFEKICDCDLKLVGVEDGAVYRTTLIFDPGPMERTKPGPFGPTANHPGVMHFPI